MNVRSATRGKADTKLKFTTPIRKSYLRHLTGRAERTTWKRNHW